MLSLTEVSYFASLLIKQRVATAVRVLTAIFDIDLRVSIDQSATTQPRFGYVVDSLACIITRFNALYSYMDYGYKNDQTFF